MSFTAFLAAGTGLMAAVMLLSARFYRISYLKAAVLALLLAAVGVAGAKLMAYVESGEWIGRSFFGAAFLPPVVMLAVAPLLRLPYGDVMDLCAPAECVMLALLKVKCVEDGCCYGKIIRISALGKPVRFPSQWVECAAALVLMAVLMILLYRRRQRGRLYAWYFLLYGLSRFCLNLMRETTPFLLGLPAGNFWSLVAIALGGLWLLASFWARKRPQNIRNASQA